MLTKFEICYIFKSSGKGTDKKQFLRGEYMKFEEISEYGIKENIRKLAGEKNKTIEGVYYLDKGYNSYCFCVGLWDTANLIDKSEDIKNVHYFKCTKSGKLKECLIKY